MVDQTEKRQIRVQIWFLWLIVWFGITLFTYGQLFTKTPKSHNQNGIRIRPPLQLIEKDVDSSDNGASKPTYFQYQKRENWNISRAQMYRQLRYQTFCQSDAKKDASEFVISKGNSVGNVPFATCLIPEAASTTLVAAYLVATGFVKHSSTIHLNQLLLGDQRFNSKCNDVRQKCLTRTYKIPVIKPREVSIIFVRDPMARLIATWSDKFNRATGRQHYYQTFGKLIRTDIPRDNFPYFSEDAWKNGFRITFPQFIQWLVRDSNYKLDNHWAPMTVMCPICSMRLSFIGIVEDLKNDLSELINILNTTVKISELQTRLGTTESYTRQTAKINEYFKDIDIVAKQKLFEIYENDYIAFGYQKPTFLLNLH